jgi:hypothetical protein
MLQKQVVMRVNVAKGIAGNAKTACFAASGFLIRGLLKAYSTKMLGIITHASCIYVILCPNGILHRSMNTFSGINIKSLPALPQTASNLFTRHFQSIGNSANKIIIVFFGIKILQRDFGKLMLESHSLLSFINIKNWVFMSIRVFLRNMVLKHKKKLRNFIAFEHNVTLEGRYAY